MFLKFEQDGPFQAAGQPWWTDDGLDALPNSQDNYQQRLSTVAQL